MAGNTEWCSLINVKHQFLCAELMFLDANLEPIDLIRLLPAGVQRGIWSMSWERRPLEMPMRPFRSHGISLALLLPLLLSLEPQLSLGGGGNGACELSVRHQDIIYNYSLASPTSKYPHGVLSEDGFYKVVVNDTSLWFQLCDQMIFNHDPPKCFGCQDCGGPLHCGMACSALVASNIEGYPVCTTIGRSSDLYIALIDQKDPLKGVLVKSTSFGTQDNCSLSVSIFCDSNEVQVPNSLNITGKCDYAVALRHPSGCAKVIYVNGRGWGLFGTVIMIILCFLVGYILLGTTYRFFFQGIHGAEAIPNLDFWLSLPHRAKNMLGDFARRLSGYGRDNRGSYAPVN